MSGSSDGGGGGTTGGDSGSWFRHTLRRGPGPWLFAAVCGVLALGFFAEFVFRPGVTLFGTDMLEQAYQLRKFAVEEVRAGRGIPLWNPFVYSGVPYVGILPGPLFYPTSLLYLVLPLFRAIGWTFVLHLFASGVLGWGAGRAFGLRRWSSAAVGLAFMFAGYVVSPVYGGHDGRMFAMVLIPAVFACAERGLETGEWAWFAGMGLVVALQIFTPHVQVMYFSSLAVTAYALYRLGWMWWESGPERGPVWRRAAGFAGGFVLAAAVGAVQILPAADLLDMAVRGSGGQGGYAFASSWALPPQELSALFLPDLVGSLRQYWGSNPFKLHTEYLGAGTLALAAVGVLAPRGDRRVWFLAGATTLGVAFSLGAATPVHRVAFELVPLVDRFRAPAMMMGPVSFFVALTAGFGVDRILDAREAEPDTDGAGGSGLPWIWIGGLSAPFLLLALWSALSPEGMLRWVRTGWFGPGAAQAPPPGLAGTLATTGWVTLLVWGGSLAAGWGVARRKLPVGLLAGVLLLLVTDLWRVDARYVDTVDPERVFSSDPVVERMQEDLRPGERVWQIQEGRRSSYSPNELMYWRIPSVTGSQNFRMAWYDRLVGLQGTRLRGLLQRPALWPLLDLRFVTVTSPVETPLLRSVAEAGRTRLYEVTADLPHAFFPDEVERARGLDAALEATRALGDPAARAVVETGEATPGADRASPLQAGAGRARVVRWHPDEVVLEVEARERGLLVVSEVWHPSWRAMLDGAKTPIYRVNGAFRGVVVPEGEHRLRFEYRSTAFRAGAALSVLAAVAGLLVVVLRWRRRA